MKVVLFCGGMGVRLREHSSSAPKPMVDIGCRPILWHIMKYYAHFGHRDFILCLGHQADVIKEYFLNYREALTNDFVLRDGGRRLDLLSNDIADWRMTFVDTGIHTSIGERLRAVRPHVAGEATFLASYGDCLSDAPLDWFADDFARRSAVASFLSVRPPYPFHLLTTEPGGRVTSLTAAADSGLRINGGFFILRQEVFDYLGAGEELVVECFERLIPRRLLVAYAYDGFWAPMDTLRERQRLDALARRGHPPWALWSSAPDGREDRVPVAAGDR